MKYTELLNHVEFLRKNVAHPTAIKAIDRTIIDIDNAMGAYAYKLALKKKYHTDKMIHWHVLHRMAASLFNEALAINLGNFMKNRK